jgi:hypothetical protein
MAGNAYTFYGSAIRQREVSQNHEAVFSWNQNCPLRLGDFGANVCFQRVVAIDDVLRPVTTLCESYCERLMQSYDNVN